MSRQAKLEDGGHIAFEVFGESGPFLFLGPQMYLTPMEFLPAAYAALPKTYVDALRDRYRVILADWPRGTGKSSRAKPEMMTRENLVRDLHAVADAAGAETFAWWGYSFGAAVGLQLARNNDRISAFVCAGFPALWQPLSDMLGVTRQTERHAANLAGELKADPDVMASGVAFYASLAGQDDWHAIAEIRCPRLVLHDVDDTVEMNGLKVDLSMRTRAAEAELKEMGWEVAWIDTGLKHGAFSNADAFIPAFAPFLDRILLGHGRERSITAEGPS